MKSIDDKIRAALAEEDAELLENYQSDPQIYELMGDIYKGRHRVISILATIEIFVMLGLAIFCGYQFFHVEGTREMIAYATSFVSLIVMMALLKTWFWMEMNKYSIMREVKRMELQLASFSKKNSSE